MAGATRRASHRQLWRGHVHEFPAGEDSDAELLESMEQLGLQALGLVNAMTQ